MQALHDQNDTATVLIVEPAVERVVVPVVDGPPLSFGERLFGLERIVDDDQVGTAARQDAADRGRQPETVGGGDELLDRLFLAGQPHREEPLIPVAGDDTAAIAS